LPSLNNHFQGVSVFIKYIHLHRCIATDGAKATGASGIFVLLASRTTQLPSFAAAFAWGKCSVAQIGRAPMTISARPKRIGLISLGNILGTVLMIVGIGVDDHICSSFETGFQPCHKCFGPGWLANAQCDLRHLTGQLQRYHQYYRHQSPATQSRLHKKYLGRLLALPNVRSSL